MDVIRNMLYGLSVVLQPMNMIWLTAGCIMGTVVGMLPGIGPATGIALLLPMTFALKPAAALIMMCAIYYGAMFGGSRCSILLNIPGDASSVVSCFDGYPMTLKGQAEAALAISALASFIGQIAAAIAAMAAALPIARFALRFGPPEYFTLMVCALAATTSLSRESLLKGFIALLLGLMVTTIGIDLQSGVQRFVFGVPELQMGIEFVVVIIGLYAITEVLENYKTISTAGDTPMQTKFGRIWITKEQWKRSIGPILRQTPVGFLIGVLPGTGGTVATMMAYNNEKQISKHPEEFGKGAIEGLAAPEAANNSCSIGAILPMITLGVPGSGTAAIMLGALMIAGLQPGPLLFQHHPDVAWGIIASMFVGAIVCLIVNLPLAGILVRLLAVPPRILYPLIIAISFLGVYTISFSIVDFYLLIVFGLLGYFMRKYDIPSAPLILAVVIGSPLEQSFRQSLILSDGSMGIFFRSGITITLLMLSALSVAYPFVSTWLLKRRQRPATVGQ
ncbi:MAG: tripartite tricarboxylate transporter permease [Clostridia bacterium]|nr:tripartite tricarboxylate transporter permease [Clostridia bacterium]